MNKGILKKMVFLIIFCTLWCGFGIISTIYGLTYISVENDERKEYAV